MNSKCVTAAQILRLLAYSAVESVRLCVHARSVICARVVCLRVFGLSLSSRRRLLGECANFCVRRITLSFFVSKIWRLRCSRLRKVRESHASICFFLIFSWFFFECFFFFFACSLLFTFLLGFFSFCPVSVRHSLFLEDPVKRKKCGDDAVRARSYLVFCRLLAWRDYSVWGGGGGGELCLVLFWFYFWRGLFVSNNHLREEAGCRG